MKNVAILILGLISASPSFAETYVRTSNPQTAQTVFALSQDCDGENEDWFCETKVENRSGTLDMSRCSSEKGGSWACYEDVKETCQDRNSGRTMNRSYRQFTGVCTDSLGDCF